MGRGLHPLDAHMDEKAAARFRRCDACSCDVSESRAVNFRVETSPEQMEAQDSI